MDPFRLLDEGISLLDFIRGLKAHRGSWALAKKKPYDDNLLHHAIFLGKVPHARVLLKRIPYLAHEENRMAETPFHLAIRTDQPEMVKLFLPLPSHSLKKIPLEPLPLVEDGGTPDQQVWMMDVRHYIRLYCGAEMNLLFSTNHIQSQ